MNLELFTKYPLPTHIQNITWFYLYSLIFLFHIWLCTKIINGIKHINNKQQQQKPSPPHSPKPTNKKKPTHTKNSNAIVDWRNYLQRFFFSLSKCRMSHCNTITVLMIFKFFWLFQWNINTHIFLKFSKFNSYVYKCICMYIYTNQ